MPPVRAWRSAPLWFPDAFDMNLCTDSVLPGILSRSGYAASGFCDHISPAYYLKRRMGPFPALARCVIQS